MPCLAPRPLFFDESRRVKNGLAGGIVDQYVLYVKYDKQRYVKYEKYGKFRGPNRRFVSLSPTGRNGYV